MHASLPGWTNVMSTLDLKKLKRRKMPEVSEQPKKKIDRFDGLSEEEVQKYTLEDYLEMNLDLVFVGINPSLMAAHRGRYYAGPGNHFYKLLHESGLTPRCISFEEDYKLLQYSIGLTNIVTRPTRSAADLKRTEIKEGAKIMKEKLKLYKPKIAVFNGKCIYEVFANIRAKDTFHFGLQPERIDDTTIWVTPSSSARCANFPRMVDKLHFYTALKKYLYFLKGEIANVDMKEFQFEGKCKQSVPSTSKMWRRKNISTFLHGGRVVNKNTLCLDTSEEDIATIHTAEFLVEKANQSTIKHNKDEDDCNQENGNRVLFNKIAEKTKGNIEKMENIITFGDVNDRIIIANGSKKEDSDINGKESCNHVINTLNHENVARHDEKCTFSKITCRTVKTRNNLKNNKSDSLDFMNLIKQKLSQKSNNNDTTNTSELKSS